MIRLAMLARDEADTLTSVARACEGLYDDYLVLVDERTTDDTIRAAQVLGARGRAEQFRFEDFAQARNRLFELAREGLGEEDFILLADPDSPPTGVLPGLIHDWYDCEWRMGQTTWRLPILVRATLDCHYEGACHELLILPHGGQHGFAEQMSVEVTPKPFNRERAEFYLDLLIPEAPTSARAAFYLARTYADLGRTGEAIEAFLRCAQMPQPAEQAFLCVLDAGVHLAALDVELARVLWERALEMRPHRGEVLYHLAWLANKCGDPEKAAGYCAQAVKQPASPDTLFVNRWAERDGVLLQLGVALDALRAGASTTIPEGS